MNTKTKPKMKQMKTHWAADIFPLNQADIDEIAESIKSGGQELPIKMFKDGTILDGRNRWLACQQLGVEPKVEVIDDLDGDQAYRLSMRLNKKRRHISKQQMACATATAWKHLYPDGAPKTGRPKKKGDKDKEERNSKNRVSFSDFAKDDNVSYEYANRALAVLNWSKEMFTEAVSKDCLNETYQTYQNIKKERKENEKKDELIAVFDDLVDLVAKGTLTRADAYAAALERTAKEREEEENRKRISRQVATFIRDVADFSYQYRETEAKTLDERIEYIKACLDENKDIKPTLAKTEKLAVSASRMVVILETITK